MKGLTRVMLSEVPYPCLYLKKALNGPRHGCGSNFSHRNAEVGPGINFLGSGNYLIKPVWGNAGFHVQLALETVNFKAAGLTELFEVGKGGIDAGGP